jgi:tRNA ligase
MASSAPYTPQDPAEIKALVDSLSRHTKGPKGGRKAKESENFSVRKATYTLADGRSVDSWRMQDWDYKKENLPTYARGLFTRRNEKTGHWEIVARGYDKFFNHGEVRNTEWPNVRKNTRGPYELSVKENGCIIFIGAVDDKTIVVCSKHSTGDRGGDPNKSHSIVGERWVEKHLATVGKTKEQLAAKLRALNVTVVAELCDDTFEEHVLAYTPDIAGLYVHGLNLNLPEFATYPHHLVDAFAEEWGFRKTTHIVENDIDKVKAFLDGVAESGAYEGRDTEGFVIRCRAREGDGGPYHDWFFKYKFEEPYLMYRQWRECTKAVISGKTPFYKKHKKITEEYLKFARKRLIENPKLGSEYNQNHGIIALRDDFLASKGLNGAEIIRGELESGEEAAVMRNVFLVPVATIGCGKTTLGVALWRIFGWEQYQNDSVVGKTRRPERFVGELINRAAFSPVVYADRNNHQRREREQLMTDISKQIHNPTFVALHWVHNSSNLPEVREALRKRVLDRGDKHQTIHATTNGEKEVIGIMDGFVRRFEPVNAASAPDSSFDLIIDLDPLLPTRENLETVITKLHDEYPALFPEDMPSTQDLDDAITWATTKYSPDVKHELKFNDKRSKDDRDFTVQSAPAASKKAAKPAKAPAVEYFSVSVPTTPLTATLKTVFENISPQRKKMYNILSQTRRIQNEFHVTLMHRASLADHSEVWKQWNDIYFDARLKTGEQDPELGACEVVLQRIIWDDRVMCIVVGLEPKQPGEDWKSVNETAHITIGTSSPSIKPFESNTLCAKWVKGDANIDQEVINGRVALYGTVKGVLRR